jgi:hypothetical protein
VSVMAGTASLSSAATLRTSSSSAPAVRTTSAPSNPTTSTSATFAFSTSGTNVRKTCRLDGKAAASCGSPKTYTGLTVGTHTFTVSATNSRGSARASYTWQVVRPAPTVTLASPPSGSTTSTSVALAWTSTNATTILCWLDSATPAVCAGPVTYPNLAVGDHTFTVKVSNGSVSSSASATWTVVTTPATTTPATTTPATTTPTTTTPTDPPQNPSAVQAPTPPSSYSIPAGAITVASSSGLISALNSSTPRDIVLADGVYDNSARFSDANGSHIYAQHLGGAVLKAGLVIGGNFGAPGGSVQGVVFDVSDPTKVLGGGIVHTWGPAGARASVLDCVFRGNNVIPQGLLALNPDGLVAQRLQFFDFQNEGIRASDNKTVSYGSATPKINSISDIYVNGVANPTPGASSGTAEAGLWIGHTVVNGVHRIKVRNASSSGIEVVNNSWDTNFSDLDIDMSGPNQSAGVGVYLEHYSYRNVFTGFVIRGANTGFNAEWADPAWGGVAGAHFTTIANGLIDAVGSTVAGPRVGVYLDEGTESTSVTGVVFRNQNWAAIGAYKNVGTNNFGGNDYSGLTTGTTAISIAHP